MFHYVRALHGESQSMYDFTARTSPYDKHYKRSFLNKPLVRRAMGIEEDVHGLHKYVEKSHAVRDALSKDLVFICVSAFSNKMRKLTFLFCLFFFFVEKKKR